MAKVKPAPTKTEEQPDLPETVDFKIELEKANEIIASLQRENVKLLDEKLDLTQQNGALHGQILDMSNSSESTLNESTTLTRKEITLAMLPQIRKQYAEADAQAMVQTVDAICHAFGVE